MTLLAHYLDDFGASPTRMSTIAQTEEALEAERLEAFDKGYRAGWDDAIKAKSDDSAHVSEKLAQNLQDLSFTYHEVHAQVLANLAPLFEEILQKMLPTIARETLGAHVVEQISQSARQMGTVTINVAVAPGTSQEVSQLLEANAGGLPVTVSESAELADGQAELHLGGREIAIDLNEMTAQITEELQAVLTQSTVERAYG